VAAVRVRFAPSPTGFLHLGSARTALFNWLWARHVGGEMLLRIEDTDRERSQPELIEVIFDALRWLGIDWDGEPVHQSDAADRHAAVVEQLLAEGLAYRCDCTQEEVQARVKAAGRPPGYDGHCRERDVAADVPHVVRFRVPDDGETSWDDLIRGTITFEHRNLEDFVLRRRDGTPMFIVANAVDDVDMGITHVIRGEDLINVTPKMLLVRRAIGVDAPIEFAHLPLIVGADRKKLSKRQGDVAVSDYRDRGILPAAMVNYLALLGWGPADGVEVRPLQEIVDLFDIADVNPAPAMFDIAKLESINGEYLRSMSPAELVEAAEPFVEHLPGYDRSVVEAMAPELQTRLKTLAELPELVDFLFADPVIDEGAWAKAIAGNEAAPAILDAALSAYADVDWTAEALHAATLAIAEAVGLKLGKAQAPIRVAVTGRTVGPPLFESLVVLGRERTTSRLAAARSRC
jgi:glutamyl-tRNA synthetase